MKKLLLAALAIISFLTPALAQAANPTQDQPLVPCDGVNCRIEDLFEMIARVYNFIVWDIATPLAVLGLLIGGIMWLISAGNPNLASKGRQILTYSVIGIVLVFCSWLIINTLLITLGAAGL